MLSGEGTRPGEVKEVRRSSARVAKNFASPPVPGESAQVSGFRASRTYWEWGGAGCTGHFPVQTPPIDCRLPPAPNSWRSVPRLLVGFPMGTGGGRRGPDSSGREEGLVQAAPSVSSTAHVVRWHRKNCVPWREDNQRISEPGNPSLRANTSRQETSSPGPAPFLSPSRDIENPTCGGPGWFSSGPQGHTDLSPRHSA